MKKLLVICKDAPISNNGSAGGIRLYQILKILSQRYELYVICRSADFGIKDLEKIGCKYIKVNQSIDKEIIELNKCVDDINYALISFWHVAELYIPMLRLIYRDIKIIIDTVDVEYKRELQKSELASIYIDSVNLEDVKRKKIKELNIYKKANMCLTASDSDKKSLNEESIIAETIPIIYEMDNNEKNFNNIKKGKIYTIGNFLHDPNIDSVLWFCNEILPLIRQESEVQFHIVGKWLPKRVQEICDGKNIIYEGVVYELDKFLKDVHISVAPLRYGAGMNGKVVEAIAKGIPLITTSIGAFPLGLKDGEHVMIADSKKEFAHKILILLNNLDTCREISKNGKEFLRNITSYNICEEKILNIFKEF